MQKSILSEKSAESLFDISIETFGQLLQDGLSLDQIFLLEKISKGIDIGTGDKITALTQTLLRKGLISEEEKITNRGAVMLSSLRGGLHIRTEKESYQIKVETAFDRWWKRYPSVDVFEHKGKKFQGSRGFKQKKEDCRQKFDKILNEGDYTADDMIRALEYEVKLKKEASVQSGENKMRYMQNSLTYLNQRTFENFIEISKQPSQVKGSADTFDI